MTLEARDITAGYRETQVLHGAGVKIAPGELVGIVGPNGSGKSTLLRVMARLHKPEGGAVLLDGEPISKLARRAIARKLAVMPQHQPTPEGLTVRELVAFGRAPHGRDPAADKQAIDHALELADMTHLSHRRLTALSGGERQRARLAMALAQSPSLLLLDEPIAALDIRHQLDVLSMLASVREGRGIGVGVVIHDLMLADRYCPRIVVLEEGLVAADGPAAEALNPGLVRRVFGVESRRLADPETGRSVLVCG